MAKNTVWFLVILVVGALIGSFLSRFVALIMPAGSVRDLFATEMTAGLSPATLDLRILDLTFGCIVKFNITSVIGMIVSAILFRGLAK